jgi:hypothetical protein
MGELMAFMISRVGKRSGKKNPVKGGRREKKI